MSFTYAIGDLHGRYDLLHKALDDIVFHAGGDNPGTIVTLGDYVDRGPQSRQIIERLMAGLRQDGHWRGWKLICLKGNHEDIMWQCCRVPSLIGWWLDNGGDATLLSYGQHMSERANPSVIPVEHLSWADSLLVMHVDTHRVYVHAGVMPGAALEEQASFIDVHGNQKVLWKRYDDNDEGFHGDRHVVHGHTPHADGPVRKTGRTNLDTYAFRTGRLVVGVFDDSIPGGPIDLIEVIGEPG
jgi:serine/threonine protein phosphatase 1